ncbi:AflYd/sugR/sugar regulator [Colletotrichum tofieldiae]|uniref:AflYd/sugR/sugar regulator n=1 Tax=Colletotrichum tofieldiae TaxID=708197 RepID=A0A166N5B0_9PEZI|nr:AflYd/sugR/sugar regulator [Colletotrichum tofieldiae]
MEKRKTRLSNPCDGCSLRREQIRQDQGSQQSPDNSDNTGSGQPPQSPLSICASHHIRQRRRSQSSDGNAPLDSSSGNVGHSKSQLPLWLYIKYLERFRDCLISVWPIVDIDSLVARLIKHSPEDYEAFALAGAVCATVIAQLRLSQLRLSKQHRSSPDISAIAESFARHAQHIRDQHSYRESESTDSLLIAFFLHIYFANTERIRAGAMYLHEAIAQLSLQKLHRPETFKHLPGDQRELMLRIFWLVFVTERTFCVQNGFPTCLSPIHTWPSEEYQVFGLGGLDSSFQLLAKIFTLLDDNLLMPGDRLVPKSGTHTADNLYQSLSAMAESPVSAIGPTLPELQRVNVMVTWNWIRILWWQYALRHYRMSSSIDDTMLSMLGPASIANQTVRLFASVSQQAIQTHGYGMELKIFRIADSLVDLLTCNRRLPSSPQPSSSMLLGARDTLHALENALVLVGGQGSFFYEKLQLFMAEVQLPVANIRTLPFGREVTVGDEV